MSGTSRTVKRSSLALMFDSLIDCMANPDTSLPGRHPDEIAFNEKHYLGGAQTLNISLRRLRKQPHERHYTQHRLSREKPSDMSRGALPQGKHENRHLQHQQRQ